MTRRDLTELAIGLVLVVAAACAHCALGPVPAFVVTAATLAVLARLVGHATEQLGARLGSGGSSVVQ